MRFRFRRPNIKRTTLKNELTVERESFREFFISLSSHLWPKCALSQSLLEGLRIDAGSTRTISPALNLEGGLELRHRCMLSYSTLNKERRVPLASLTAYCSFRSSGPPFTSVLVPRERVEKFSQGFNDATKRSRKYRLHATQQYFATSLVTEVVTHHS